MLLVVVVVMMMMLVVVVVTFRCQLAHVTSFLFCTTPMSAISDASFYDEEITNPKQPSKQTIT